MSKNNHPNASHLDCCIRAATCIRRAWCRYRDKKRFLLIKRLLLKSEHTLTHQLLRRLHPNEVALLKDPVTQARVRFRLGGATFPPTVYYKIYTRGVHVHYLSHQLTWTAPEQACKMMGAKKYMQAVTQDLQWYHLFDVVNAKEYQRYLSDLDTRPVSWGGRNNEWRPIPTNLFPWSSPTYVSTTHWTHPPSPSTPSVRPLKAPKVSKKWKKIEKRKLQWEHWKAMNERSMKLDVKEEPVIEDEDEWGTLFAWADALDITTF
ncbi:putative protein CXorf58 [Coelomomyces lativittatus]|nr:putative protein CXorf58 [Coelomomyces lativittatus]KAJ1504927.1 putative protein CXorf58 [Coelomomyces lativittatus]